VAPSFQFQGKSDEWIGIAVGANIRKDNAQNGIPQSVEKPAFMRLMHEAGPMNWQGEFIRQQPENDILSVISMEFECQASTTFVF
jgi:hypothetical protein